MNLGIEGRSVLVVGASKGIGLEVTRELRAEGCRVFTVARTGRVDFLMDLMQEGAVGLLLTSLTLTPPDIIVHVIGGSQGLTDPLGTSDDWSKVWRLNLGISHDINRAFIPLMQRNKWGRIIHLTSLAAEGLGGYCPYSSSKAALNGYVKSMSREFSKDGVIITAVRPGTIYTKGRYYASLPEKDQEEYFNRYIPIHRFGRAEEVAKVVAFLASDHAAYMAGAIVGIDGGAR